MKQLIVLAAVLPLLLLFLVQYGLDQKNTASGDLLQQYVYAAKEQAKQDGCFTPEIQAALRTQISEGLGIPAEEVEITATETPKYRTNVFEGTGGRGMIQYEVSVPVDQIMAGSKLFGLSEEENSGVYTVRGTTASELLPY